MVYQSSMSAAQLVVPPRPDFGVSGHSSMSAELQQHVSHIIAAAHHLHRHSEGDGDHSSEASDDDDDADEAIEDEDSGVF